MSAALVIPLVVALFLGAVAGLVGLVRATWQAPPAGPGTPTPRPRLVVPGRRDTALARWNRGELSLEEFLAVARRGSLRPDVLRSRPLQHRNTDQDATRALRPVRPLHVVASGSVTR